MTAHVDMLVSAGVRSSLAAKLLVALGGIAGVARASSVELARNGVSPKLADRLVASFAVARASDRDVRAVMGTAADVAALLRPRIGHLAQETFWMVALDVRNGLIDAVEVSRGTLTSVEVHPREVFSAALRLAAAGIVIAHNHPSGDATPSPEDIALTTRLRNVGALIGIPVVDHVVVTRSGYTSIAEYAPVAHGAK